MFTPDDQPSPLELAAMRAAAKYQQPKNGDAMPLDQLGRRYWPNFSANELACRHCGMAGMNADFMDNIQAMRTEAGFPFNVTSAYRCKVYDDQIDGAGVHPLGLAIDIACSGQAARMIFALALRSLALTTLDIKTLELDPTPAPRVINFGITGIGLRQHGPHKGRFIHLDAIPETDPTHPRPWIWTYDQAGRRTELSGVLALVPKINELGRIVSEARRSLNQGATELAKERLRLVHDGILELVMMIDQLGIGGAA